MTTAARLAIDWVEQGLVPDSVIRKGIRRLCRERLKQLESRGCETAATERDALLAHMSTAPIAPAPLEANEQHYEVPEAFFARVLGPRRKYSCCYWTCSTRDLPSAEAATLDITCKRADLRDGQDILELGCGWGSLSLWMAERFPGANITAVSNSESQRRLIVDQARNAGLTNLRVITADVAELQLGSRFDRVVSVEMFEHLRNWGTLMQRIHGWLKPAGRLFVHIFCHRKHPYLFEDQGPSDWMSRHFFTGGMMPSDDLPLYFQRDLHLLGHWRWGGRHYEKTANAWLANMDANKESILPILAETYGPHQADIWWMRWRIFFMACAETFAFDGGDTWWVSHYLFERPGA
jgi:cyclopropane-fatty-acyl-phospholipid synthase